MKSRARRAASAMAGELINLYAERQVRTGHTFPPDGEMQMEFEAAFPYRETADQMDAIDAVKADMESERPMDRLICGDVGYGKTEIALRAGAQGRRRRQAGDDAGPDDDPRPAALRHLPRALRRHRVQRRDGLAAAQAGRDQGGAGALRRGQGGHPDRHPPPALARRPRQGPRPDDRGRGAALRRQAEGAAPPAQAQGRRPLAVRDADPAHPADVARRPPRHLRDRDARPRAAARSAPTSAPTTRTW